MFKRKRLQEVTLLGQNVNAYGKDLDDNYNMENLLEDVAKTNIPRIRFVQVIHGILPIV